MDQDPVPVCESADQPAAEVGAWCPRCSSRLVNHRCKLLCEKCGYFMSCSDFDR